MSKRSIQVYKRFLRQKISISTLKREWPVILVAILTLNFIYETVLDLYNHGPEILTGSPSFLAGAVFFGGMTGWACFKLYKIFLDRKYREKIKNDMV